MIPLSTRMRPDKLEDFVGQEHFLYPGSLLYNAIKNKTFDSAIFHGPSGTGKTTLARIIANEMDSSFTEINASTTGTKELKELIEGARLRFFGLEKRTTYVYIDEFHRWNKLQQDSLLKALEDGVLKFIGSTTENPYFAINNAVLSRVRNVYEFKRLEAPQIKKMLLRALTDTEKGFGNLHIKYDEEALDILADLAGGDGRVSLDTLGFIVDNLDLSKKITKEMVAEAMQRKIGFYSKGDDRYNLLSALQKSIRGSDPDAAIHYFARLVDGGADIQMIGRRLLVIASEDIGMAYPKSNAASMAYFEALSDVKSRNIDDVPMHLMDSHYQGAKDKGIGRDYLYPHDFGGYVAQQYLPDNLYAEGVKYYRPTANGSEASFKKFLEGLEEKYGRNHKG